MWAWKNIWNQCAGKVGNASRVVLANQPLTSIVLLPCDKGSHGSPPTHLVTTRMCKHINRC
jgi:hypothetical protein